MATTMLFSARDYRGATIEDLDIPPAISINPSTPLDVAAEIAFEHEFTYLPVIHESNKRLLGVLNVEQIRSNPQKIKNSFLKPITQHYMLWFNYKAKERYEKEVQNQSSTPTPLNATIRKPRGKRFDVLTPWTPLEELARFFNSGQYFAIVTNDEGNFVYGVATPEDLSRYENSRPRL